ncbi:MAG: CARDB domain-containing protein [Patescibacteria group bacterium]|jgi:hypothetical protein
MKKIFFGLTLGIMFFLVSSSVQAAYTPMSGDIIKIASGSALYYVDDYSVRHLFPNSATFWTWYTGSWSDQKIKTISPVDFESLTSGKNITARPGVRLIQFDNSSKVFALTSGAVLCEVRALYGDNWKSQVITIQSSFENDYIKDSTCSIISTSKYPDGSIIQYVGSKDVWYIEGGKKRLFSGTSFAANGLREEYIIKNVPVSIAYTSGTKIVGVELGLKVGSIVNSSSNPSSSSSGIDLAVTDIVFPAGKVYLGSIIDIGVVIKNLGANLTSGKGIRGTVLTAQNWTTDLISHVDFPSATNPLKTNQTFTINYRGKFTAIGDKTVTFKVDEGNELAESNENNNSFSEKVSVIK